MRHSDRMDCRRGPVSQVQALRWGIAAAQQPQSAASAWELSFLAPRFGACSSVIPPPTAATELGNLAALDVRDSSPRLRSPAAAVRRHPQSLCGRAALVRSRHDMTSQPRRELRGSQLRAQLRWLKLPPSPSSLFALYNRPQLAQLLDHRSRSHRRSATMSATNSAIFCSVDAHEHINR